MNGRIEYRPQVHCGKCERFLGGITTKPGRMAVREELRRLGWALTRAWGWICPDCDDLATPEVSDGVEP